MDEKDPYELDDTGDKYSRKPDADAYATPQEDDASQDFDVPTEPDAPTQPGKLPEPIGGPAPDEGPTYVSVPCVTCGYNLTGIAIGGVCPECGSRVDDSLYAAGASPPNAFAITSMVIGIVSVVGLCCCWGGFLGALGLVFGIIAMNQIKTGGYSSSSNGMALAGVICSSVALAGTLVFLVLAILG